MSKLQNLIEFTSGVNMQEMIYLTFHYQIYKNNLIKSIPEYNVMNHISSMELLIMIEQELLIIKNQ